MIAAQDGDRPLRLLGPDGFARPAYARAPLADVDLADARIPAGPLSLPAPLARARLKQWQHVCVVADEWLLTLAVVDAAYMKLAWVQAVHIPTGERVEHARQLPVADAHVARSLWNEQTWFRGKGFALTFHSHLEEGVHRVRFSLDASRTLPAVRGELTFLAEQTGDGWDVEPLVVCLPVGRARCMYSHKVPLPAAGTFTVGDRTATLDPARSFGILDVHKAHYPRRMFWRWATFAGRTDTGASVGLNLTKNVVEDDATWNENALWVDGRLYPLGPAVFSPGDVESREEWEIASADDAVNLTFTPLGHRGENLHIPGIATSRFAQLYGRFHGTVSADGAVHAVDGMLGLCEDHHSVW